MSNVNINSNRRWLLVPCTQQSHLTTIMIVLLPHCHESRRLRNMFDHAASCSLVDVVAGALASVLLARGDEDFVVLVVHLSGVFGVSGR